MADITEHSSTPAAAPVLHEGFGEFSNYPSYSTNIKPVKEEQEFHSKGYTSDIKFDVSNAENYNLSTPGCNDNVVAEEILPDTEETKEISKSLPSIESEDTIKEDSNTFLSSSESQVTRETSYMRHLTRSIIQSLSCVKLPKKKSIHFFHCKIGCGLLTIKEQVKTINRLRSSFNARFFKGLTNFLIPLLLNVIWFLMFAVPVVFALWYREEQIAIGYCNTRYELNNTGTTSEHHELWNILGTYLEATKPKCIPCPEHASCYANMQLICDNNYERTTNYLSLFKLIPLADSCHEASAERVLEIANHLTDVLRKQNARIQCGKGANDLKSGLSEKHIFNLLSLWYTWVHEENFDDLWLNVQSELKKKPDISFSVVPVENSTNSTLWLRSNSRRYINLKCFFQPTENIMKQSRYIFVLLLLIFIIYGLWNYVHGIFERRHGDAANIEQLFVTTLRLLQDAKKEKDMPFVNTLQIKDQIFKDIKDMRTRLNLWKKVSAKLEEDKKQIKVYHLEVDGEIMECWEWIDPISNDFNTI